MQPPQTGEWESLGIWAREITRRALAGVRLVEETLRMQRTTRDGETLSGAGQKALREGESGWR